MRKAGCLSGELHNDRTPVGDGDGIIGATADIVEEPVLIRNVDDFERFGVETETTDTAGCNYVMTRARNTDRERLTDEPSDTSD